MKELQGRDYRARIARFVRPAVFGRDGFAACREDWLELIGADEMCNVRQEYSKSLYCVEASIQTPILNSFPQMLRPDPLAAGKIADCPCDFQDPVVRAG